MLYQPGTISLFLGPTHYSWQQAVNLAAGAKNIKAGVTFSFKGLLLIKLLQSLILYYLV